MLKNILVTGGAGFIGSNIVEYLLNHTDNNVVVLDNLSTGFQSNVDLFKDNPRYTFIKGDISDYKTCQLACKNIDIICAQAALGSVPRSMEDPLNSCKSNITGFMTLLQVAKEYGIKRFVYASSSSVFGTNNEKKKRDGELGEPLSVYAVTKLVNEKIGTIFSDTFNMEIIGLRYFNVFGKRQSFFSGYPAVIPIFVHNAKKNKDIVIFGDGTNSRDFTYIKNVIQANMNAMTTTNENCFGKIFNIGCDDSTTILNLAEKIKNIFNSQSKIVFGDERIGDVPHSHSDISLSKELLGYNPTFSLEQGLADFLN
jgi:UDP-N-acetylglucosamine 4-epimerase